MGMLSNDLLGGLLLCCAMAPARAATLTDIGFKSNGMSFINDTIAEGSTSPLAFTADSGLNQPFLNAADPSICPGFGSYDAIAFLGFGQHVGPGLVSFREDGGALVTQNVTFPDPASASGVFASFELPGGGTATIAATGLRPTASVSSLMASSCKATAWPTCSTLSSTPASALFSSQPAGDADWRASDAGIHVQARASRSCAALTWQASSPPRSHRLRLAAPLIKVTVTI